VAVCPGFFLMAPFTLQQTENNIVDPCIPEPQAFYKMSLLTHAEPARHRDRGDIPRVDRTENPVLAEAVKQIRHRSEQRFGSVTMPLMSRIEADPEFGLAIIVRGKMQSEVTDQAVVLAQANSELKPSPRGTRLDIRLILDKAQRLRLAGRRPALIAGNIGVGTITKQVAGIAGHQSSQIQAFASKKVVHDGSLIGCAASLQDGVR